jgi:hypothetical protein
MNAIEARSGPIKASCAAKPFHVLSAESPNSLLYTQSRDA